MDIISIDVTPKKVTADVYDAVTVTVVKNNENKKVHLKTYIVNKEGHIVGKTETDFEVKVGVEVAVEQSVLTYSPDTENEYTIVCEIEGTKKDGKFMFPVL